MPTYEYACRACDHNFEIVQSFSEDTLTTCPACEQDALRKVYNAAGIIFKGDGWHVKDYASSGSSRTSSGDEGSGSTSSDTASSTETPSSTSGTTSKKKPSTSSSGSGDGAARPAAG